MYFRSALNVNESQNSPSYLDHRNVLLPLLTLPGRQKGNLLWVVENQTSIRKVQTMFFQVRLPFGFVPNEHELIVSTFWGRRTSGGIVTPGWKG